ncbi:MAG: hypothetical protein H7Y00_07240 [Fimbriimonadaceae bacterium]|nr:hypothetical protein [Chitinophagales bacterium]
MKKLQFVFILILVAGSLLPSCTKCTVCTHIDMTSGEEVIDEYCAEGLSAGKLVSDYEAEWAENWEFYGGYCTRN